jgi:hypothetical protein
MCLLFNPIFFSDRNNISDYSASALIKIVRNIYRILVHILYHNWKLYNSLEDRYRIGERLSLWCKRFNIIDNETDINSNIPSNINTNISNTFENEKNEIRITQVEKTFLDLKEELPQDFLKKYAYNYNLYIFPNIYKNKGKKNVYPVKSSSRQS